MKFLTNPTDTMNHPYQTQREKLHGIRKNVSKTRFVQTILKATPEDRQCICERRDADVSDCYLRSILQEHAYGLANVIEGIPGMEVYVDEWKSLFKGSEWKDTMKMQEALTSCASSFQERMEELELREQESDPSTCSDYSDSRTVSSEENGSEEEESED